MSMHQSRIDDFRERLAQAGIDVALITDDDNIYYLTGYHGYLHMEFGRPTILAVPLDGDSLLITPTLDLNTALDTATVDQIAAWNDGLGSEWREELPGLVRNACRIGIEPDHMPPVVRANVGEIVEPDRLVDANAILAGMRMIKSEEELQLARHAGQVANAMMEAGRGAIADGVPEFEVALAISAAGTRRAAELLATHYDDADMSPNMHFLQIMASGECITRTHHRASTRIMRRGEPVFLCFCGMTNFRRFKLGFDRTFWIGEIAERSHEAVYEVAVASQRAALDALRPGVTAESVHTAYAEVIAEAGFEYPFRCGRATGLSFLERPQLVTGDTTIIQPGMVLVVDGSVSVESFRAQVGDSFIITENGWEAVTSHPKSLDEVVLQG